jgi:hypothetical protein
MDVPTFAGPVWLESSTDDGKTWRAVVRLAALIERPLLGDMPGVSYRWRDEKTNETRPV